MNAITQRDIIRYITAIRLNFENAYKTQNDDEMKILVNTWYSILKEYPKEICDRAVIVAIRNAEFAPRIGSIVKEIEKMLQAFQKDEIELWSEFEHTLYRIRECAYRFQFNMIEANGKTQGENAYNRATKIFENLEPELKEYCHDLRGLINISRLNNDQLSYEKSRFIKMIPTLRERSKTRARLSGDMSKLIQNIAEKMALPDGSEETKNSEISEQNVS